VRTVFEVMPAIDVSAGRLAQLGPGGPVAARAFGGDPLAAARTFTGAGARWIHVVDLDLAFDGETRNLETIAAIATLGPRVQAAGGVRSDDEVRALLAAGASRVVVGSAVLAAPQDVAGLVAAHGERLAVGIEVDGGRIRSRGRDPVDLELMETLGRLVEIDVAMLLVTAVARVAGLGGPDVPMIRRVVRAGRPVLAAGGVSRPDHLRDLRAAGAAGAVVGRAALEGVLDLAAVLAAGT
jgi:phosphoribosylformimino-5-aminoimidazole carboxamide ribonucleotide (ProFAR) isomerase